MGRRRSPNSGRDHEGGGRFDTSSVLLDDETGAVVETDIPMPVLATAVPLAEHHLRVTWIDGDRAGRTDEIDLKPLLDRSRFFRKLRGNTALFRTVTLSADGNKACWDDPSAPYELEIAATQIERLAREQDAKRDPIVP